MNLLLSKDMGIHNEELMDLYNKWENATMFLSTGNCSGKEWEAMKEYCKNNIVETIDFAIELYTYSVKEGEDNGIGWMFLDIIEELFNKDQKIIEWKGYIPPIVAIKTWLSILPFMKQTILEQ